MFVLEDKSRALVPIPKNNALGAVIKFSDLVKARSHSQDQDRGQNTEGYQTTASFGMTNSVPSGGGSSINVGGLVTGINLDPLLWEVAPEQLDEEQFPYQLMRMYRDIYYFDSVAGATVDTYSSLPFSNWTLSGMEDKKLAKFEESLQRLNIEQLLPALTHDYLVQGAFLGTMFWNKQDKLFTDIMCMMPEHCKFTQLPLFGQEPVIEYTTPDKVKRALALKSSRIEATVERMGSAFSSKLKKGKFELSPLTTLFIPRTTSTNRIGCSWLKRILPIYLVEKNLWKGTMIESTRRIRSILHLMVGDTEWEPTMDQIAGYGDLFRSADADPLGAIVATRAGVNTQELRSGGDFWSIMNVWSDTVPAKLRALGISESFLAGDATLQNMETSISVFLDGLRQYRHNITNKVFYSRIFPIISLSNGYTKNGKNVPRELRDLKNEKLPIETFLRALQSTDSLDMPQLRWTKTLEPEGDEAAMTLLEKMEEKGVPIPIRAWAAAGGVDLNEIISESGEDRITRAKLAKMKIDLDKYVQQKTGQKPESGEGGGSGGEGEELPEFEGEFSTKVNNAIRRRQTKNSGVLRFSTGASTDRMKIGDRDYGQLSEARVRSKTGKWVALSDAQQRRVQKQANEKIIKALKNLKRKR